MNIQNQPLVTVIIPAYNHENYIEESIFSVINQTYTNIELIILNDGSKDKTHQVINKLIPICKNRFKKFEYINKANEGVAKTLNQGVSRSKGKYISFLASDDTFHQNKIKILVNEFYNLSDEYACVCGDANFIDDTGATVYLDNFGRISQEAKTNMHNSFIKFHMISFNPTETLDTLLFKTFGKYETFLKCNYIPAMATLIKKDVIIEMNFFTESIRIEDLDMWLKITKKYKIKYVDKVVANYRWHSTNTVKQFYNEIIQDHIKLLLREKKYCYYSNLKYIWGESFTSDLFILFNEKEYLYFIKYLRHLNYFMFMKILIQKLKSRKLLS